MTRDEAIDFIAALLNLRGKAIDEVALESTGAYPTWKDEQAYEVGDRVLYKDILYRVITAHTSQTDWTPDVAASLFAKVLIPDEDVVPAWEQPGSTNPYMTGDKVTHNGKTWVSDIDNNVWEPGVYGWSEVQ